MTDGGGKKIAKSQNPWMHLIAGGCAGLVESSACHPLDTIKVGTREDIFAQGGHGLSFY
jgi:Mitochondrial carrier protein